MPGRTVTRDGVKGTIVNVRASQRFVPEEYPGDDPRTKAAHRKKR
jgi:hypothetical protein